MDKRLFIEIGNSFVKAAVDDGGNNFSISRYDSVLPVVDLCTSFNGEIVCVPVGERLSNELLPQLPTASLHVLRPSDIRSVVVDSYDTPETLGLDRILNLVGAGDNAVVVSCGTAITVDAVVDGVWKFGAILPGFYVAANGLHEHIPTLPHVSPANATPLLPARTSTQSVENGILLGTARGTQGIVNDLSQLVFDDHEFRVLLTGGDATLMQQLWNILPIPAIDQSLLFRGMRKLIPSI